MKNFVRLMGVTAVALSLPACATITRGTQETYQIVSTPPGADVTLSTGQTCTTPCKLKLKRKTEFVVNMTMPGYEPFEGKVDSKIKGGGVTAAAGNLLAGGIIGGIVDGTNGSMRDLTPNPLNVTLIPLGQAPVAPTGGE
jgi:hypothetical protein